jgi:hypothetical protein
MHLVTSRIANDRIAFVSEHNSIRQLLITIVETVL